jgi:hypothetical protein
MKICNWFNGVVLAVCGNFGCLSTELLVESPSQSEMFLVVENLPVVPDLRGALGERVLRVLASPEGAANHRDVFIKVGDSITQSQYFLTLIGCGGMSAIENAGAYTSLQNTVAYFSAREFPRESATPPCTISNSFSRNGLAALYGTTSVAAFNIVSECAPPNNRRLLCEVQQTRPAYAIVEYGTNDLREEGEGPLRAFRMRMQTIVSDLLQRGVVPVLSTIPPLIVNTTNGPSMVASVRRYNQVIAAIAIEHEVPLINFYRACLEVGPSQRYGMDADGIHPRPLGAGASIFTEEGLRAGYNVRNLITLQTLEALRNLR